MSVASQKGPVSHRLWVFFFSVLFGLLVYWLLGFILQDIGNWPGPDYSALEDRMLDSQTRQRVDDLRTETSDVTRRISDEQKRQQLLKDGIDNQRRTMDQLLAIQRLSLERSESLTDEAQAAMSASIERFLADQQQYQQLSEQIASLNEQLVDLREEQREAEAAMEEAVEPIREEYERLRKQHNFKLAAVKLAVLVPLLLVVLALFVRYRENTYAPLVYAAGVAVAAKVLVVMHDHFPREYFKYILILVSLAVVTWILVRLLGMIAHPKSDWLLKQYRDAYEAFLCPACSYPIRRGPLQYLAWTRRSIRKASMRGALAATPVVDDPYTCPMCGTTLFEKCDTCGGTRPALLPACDKCGAQHDLPKLSQSPTSPT